MPELPEVERARQAIEAALDREIVGVDDGDEWVCRCSCRPRGAHTGEAISFRKEGAACPRCGAPMEHGRVGGRSTWWCSAEQS
ncbi:hypothetical protein [Pseudonocardia sp. DLS-67]